MSEMRVSQQAISSLVADFSSKIAKTAGSEVAQEAGKILQDVTQSLFAKAPNVEGKVADRLPNALHQLTQQLKGMGVDAQTIGEVLNRLNEMLGKNRAMRPARTLKKALKGGKLPPGSAPPEKMADLQAAIDSQSDAADLLEEQEQAQQQAKKNRYGNF